MNIFKSLEIDVEKGIYKLNSKDLKQCQEIAITIKPEKAEVLAVTTKDIFYETLAIDRKIQNSALKTGDTVTINVNAKTDAIDRAIEKVNELHKKITEVRTLADEVTAVISNQTTKKLVDELGMREGVEKIIAEPYKNTTISVEGPAVILKIID